MDRHAGKIVVNRMTARRDRRPRALDPGYVGIDERSLPELCDFAVKVARLVHYHGPNNERDGHFGAFFLADPAMVLASIAATPLGGLEADFADLERRAREARPEAAKLDLLRQVFASILGLARLVDRWLRHLGHLLSGGAAEVVRHAIESAIDEALSEELRRLAGYGEGAAVLGHPIRVDRKNLSPIWRAEHVCSDDSIYHGHTRARKIDHALPALGAIFGVFHQAIAGLQALARAQLGAVLGEGNHPPHLALYLAFAQLFQRAQGALDGFGSRYVDFYHREVLRETPLGPVGDSVYLTFTLAAGKGVESAVVPAGARFSAGKDEQGVDIVFASRQALRVGAARLDRLRALSVARGPLPPGADGATLVQRVLATEITPGAAPFAAFGQPSETDTDTELTAAATLGFAVASPYLLLGGGQRTLQVWLRCSPASVAALRPRLERLAAATHATAAGVLRSALSGAFTLHLTTAAGWLAIDAYEALVDEDVLDDPVLALQIVLPPDGPAIAPIDPAAGGNTGGDPVAATDDIKGATTPAPALPGLKAYLNQDPITLAAEPGGSAVSVHALSLLADLEVVAIWLDMEVSGLTDLALESPGGAISAQKPFFLFGAAPATGAYLDVQHPEIFVKRPDSVDVRIDWFKLPPNGTGFKGYYREYGIGLDGVKRPGLFDNRVFQVSLTVQRPGAWELGPDAQNLYLFRTHPSADPTIPDAAGRLGPTTAWGALSAVPRAPPAYYDGSKSAIRVSLVAPREGFGDSVYAANVLAAVNRTEPDVERCRSDCALFVQPLADAAELLQASLDLCGRKTEAADCRRCFRSSLSMCRAMLVKALMDALGTAAQAELDPEVSRGLADAAKAAGSAAPDARKQAVGVWLDATTKALGTDPGTDGWKCQTLWDAWSCLDGCEAEAEPLGPAEYRARLSACLTDCRAKLDKARTDGLAACVDRCTRAQKELKVPSAPWLPQAERVSLGYAARCLVTGAPPAELAGAEQAGAMFHLLPFGGFRPWGAGETRLLPAEDREGSLLLGFTGLAPDDSLTLLVHLAGTGDAAGEAWPEVAWECLSGDTWTPLLPVARSDTTAGLRRTGSLQLSLPGEDLSGNTVLSGDHQWIRASVPGGAARFPRVAGVYPHAVLCAWQDNGNTGAHLASPRPPGSIKASIDELAGIDTIAQPIESSGGRPPETPETMPIRLGERLRHKERGVVGWDYERLVLERFPEVDRVRTLPARGADPPKAGGALPTVAGRGAGGPAAGAARGAAPGEVTVVVLPGPVGYRGPDPTAPALDADTLAAIEASLAEATSPFVAVHVVNPVYVRITVTAAVEFTDDEDPGVSRQLLGDYLVQELSPWCLDPPWMAAGQDYPTEDDVAELIRTRPYVSALVDVSLQYTPDPAGLDWYLLTSATEHRIQIAPGGPPHA